MTILSLSDQIRNKNREYEKYCLFQINEISIKPKIFRINLMFFDNYINNSIASFTKRSRLLECRYFLQSFDCNLGDENFAYFVSVGQEISSTGRTMKSSR
jgi:hypothetical protein